VPLETDLFCLIFGWVANAAHVSGGGVWPTHQLTALLAGEDGSISTINYV
jgi:hypothetical protein